MVHIGACIGAGISQGKTIDPKRPIDCHVSHNSLCRLIATVILC